jgi:hypothetical protein
MGWGICFSWARMPRLASKRKPVSVRICCPVAEFMGKSRGVWGWARAGAYIMEKSRSKRCRCWPPSTSSVVPVMDWLSSAKHTVAATSAALAEAVQGLEALLAQHVAGQRQARGHADHAHARRQGQRQHGACGLKRCLGQRVAEEIGVLVPELLVQHVDHGAAGMLLAGRHLR